MDEELKAVSGWSLYRLPNQGEEAFLNQTADFSRKPGSIITGDNDILLLSTELGNIRPLLDML